MNPKEQKENFNKRWNITTSVSAEEAFKNFKQRILNAFRHIENQLTGESITQFCQIFSIDEQWQNIGSNRLSKNIVNQIERENDPIEIYRIIEIILSLKFKNYMDYELRIEVTDHSKTIKNIKEAIEMSDVNVTMIEHSNGQIRLYPKGEEHLDEKLVNKTLSFLNKESNIHFEEALKFYQNNKPIKSVESLRRALEEFLRYKLKNDNEKNDRGLTENIKFLQKKLKEENIKKIIRNIIFKTFDYLDKYFNENSKHKDGNIDEVENEFLIYQTGLLLRYINSATLKK